MEYAPLGPPLPRDQFLLHETGYLARNYAWNFANMVGPFWRLFYNTRPGHTVVFADREVPLEPGHLLMIPDHLLFHTHGIEVAPHFWMSFSLGLFPATPGPRVLPVGSDEAELIWRICGNFTAPAEGDRFAIFHQSMALLHLIVSRPDIGWSETSRSPAAIQIAEYVGRNFASVIEVPALARQAGMTARALSAMFQREYHVSPTRFVTRVRTSEVARLLTETELSLDAIAEQTGFPNRFYLTRVFTKLTGKAPATYRRESRRAREAPDEQPG